MTIWERVRELSISDPVLRDRIRALAAALTQLTDPPRPTEPPPPPRREPLPPITFHLPRPDPSPTVAPAPMFPVQPQVADIDLPVIEARCRLKAAAARCVGERRRRERSGTVPADSGLDERDLIAQAKVLPDCFLWMCHREPAVLHAICLATMTSPVASRRRPMRPSCVSRRVRQPRRRRAICSAARPRGRAQPVVRVVVGMIDPGYVDNDQLKLFIWSRRESAAEWRTLIRRHMKRDDPADPAGWLNARDNIAALTGRKLRKGRDREKRRKQRPTRPATISAVSTMSWSATYARIGIRSSKPSSKSSTTACRRATSICATWSYR